MRIGGEAMMEPEATSVPYAYIKGLTTQLARRMREMKDAELAALFAGVGIPPRRGERGRDGRFRSVRDGMIPLTKAELRAIAGGLRG